MKAKYRKPTVINEFKFGVDVGKDGDITICSSVKFDNGIIVINDIYLYKQFEKLK